MKDQRIRIATPHEFTAAEIAASSALIRQGAEVELSRLADYLTASHLIGMLFCGSELACVATIKAVRADYIRAVSKRSGYDLDSAQCSGEFGYVVTQTHSRRQGLAERLSTEVLSNFHGDLFATTRDDNPGIHRILLKNNFRQVGTKWPSKEHPESMLVLWLRK